MARLRSRFGQYTVEITHRDKALIGDAITKADVIAYYQKVHKRILPFLRKRPVILQRFPDGIDEDGFYQRNLPDYFPDWFARCKVKTGEGSSDNESSSESIVPVCNNMASLSYLANQGTLVHHAWLSRVGALNQPDQMIFDLDPPNAEFEPVREAARDCLQLLDDLHITGFVKTTGSRGLHVVVPIRIDCSFDHVRDFAQRCAQVLVDRFPQRYTLEQRKKSRHGRLYLDVLRNAYGQSAVAPFSLRARPHAPIAMPINHKPLDNPKLHSQAFCLRDSPMPWDAKDADPWCGFRRHAVDIQRAFRRLTSIRE